jgi:hypothetical protein
LQLRQYPYVRTIRIAPKRDCNVRSCPPLTRESGAPQTGQIGRQLSAFNWQAASNT